MNFRFKTIAMHQLAHCWRIHFMHGDRADLHSIISGEGVAIQGLNSDIDLDTDQRSAISCLNTSPNYRNLSERENIKNGQLESKTIKLARRLQINSFWYSILHACWCYIYFPCEHSVESICRAWAKLSISLMLGVDSHNSFISYTDCVVQKYSSVHSDSHKYLKNFQLLSIDWNQSVEQLQQCLILHFLWNKKLQVSCCFETQTPVPYL